MPTTSILIADDHALFRAGIKALIEAEPDLHVAGEASGGQESVQLARLLKPDILLLDLAMPPFGGLDVLREMKGDEWKVRSIVVTASIDKKQILEALQLGARGVVLKESASAVLMNGIRTVIAGQYWVGHDSIADLLNMLQTRSEAEQDSKKNFGLSQRELEVVSAISLGYSNRQIAKHLSLSEDTIKHHVTNIFNKLGVSTRVELVVAAIHHELIEKP